MIDAARRSLPRGRRSWRRAVTRLAAVGIAGLLGLSGVQCVQDFITSSRPPHYGFLLSTRTLKLAVGDSVQVPAASLVIDNDTIVSPIRLTFLHGGAGNGVVSFDSAGRLTARRRGYDTLTVSPKSSALAVDTLVDTLVVQGVAYRLSTRAVPTIDTIRSLQATMQLSVTAWGTRDSIVGQPVSWRVVGQRKAVTLVNSASGLVRADSNGVDTLEASLDDAIAIRVVRVRQRPTFVLDAPIVHLWARGQTYQLNPQVTDSSAHTVAASIAIRRWDSGDSAVATVSATGLVTATAQVGDTAPITTTILDSARATPLTFTTLVIVEPGRVLAKSGNNQTGTVNAVLAAPLVVQLANSLGVQKTDSGVPVRFDAYWGGGSFDGQGSSTVKTNVGGLASVTLTLGRTAGVDSVKAYVIGGAADTVRVGATAVAAAADSLAADSGDAQTGTVGGPLAHQLVARVSDAYGNPVSGQSVTFQMTAGAGKFQRNQGTADTVSTDAAGRAKTTLILGRLSGANAVQVSSLRAAGGALTGSGLTFAATAVAATPARLFIVTQPRNVNAGAGIAPAIAVAVQDTFGNVVTLATPAVALTIKSGTGSVGAHLSGSAGTAVAGIATLGAVAIDIAGSNYQLIATAPFLSADTSQAFSVAPGSVDHLAFVQQPSITGVGVVIAPSVRVAVLDAFSNTVSSDSGVVTVAVGTTPVGGSQTVYGTRSRVVASGVATFDDLSLAAPATGYRLQASHSALNANRFVLSDAFTVRGSPAAIALISGSNQNGVVSTDLAQPFVVRVGDQSNNPISGDSVVFKVTAGGGTFATNGLDSVIALTDASGLARATLTLGAVAGTNTVVARSVHIASQSATFTASGTPSTLVLKVTTEPANTTGGVPFASPIQVTVEDAIGAVQSGTNVYVALSIQSGTGRVGAALHGTTSVLSVNGVATFSGVAVDSAGTGYKVIASATGLAPDTTAAFDVTVGPAAQLGFRSLSSSVQAGTTLPVAVEIRDVGGNPVTSAGTTNTVAVALLGGTAGAHLLGTAQLAATSGVATFTGLNVDSAGTGYTLRATATGLTGAMSAAFTVTPGDATRLLFASAPAAQVVAGTPIAIQVALVDAFGNRSVQSTNQVSLILGGPGVALGGSLVGTTTQAPSSGTAVFSVRVRKAAAAYTLQATATTLTASSTVTFDVVAGAPKRLGFLQQPTGAAPGATIAPAVTVEVRDSADNRILTATNAVTLAVTGGTATLSGTKTQSASAGLATFADLSIATAGSNYTLTATATSLDSAVSSAFSIVTAGQDRPVFTTVPSLATAGTPFSVVVQIQDGSGNVRTTRTDSVTVAIAAGTGTTSATLRGSHLKVAAVSGVATFPDLTIDSAGTGYALTATVSGLPVATSPSTFAVSAGAAAQVAFRTQPTSRSAGNLFSPAVQVVVLDGVGNLVASATDSITLGITSGTGRTGATLLGTKKLKAVAGVASFADLSIDSAGTGYTLTASATNLVSSVSNAFSIAVGVLTRVVVTPAGASLSGVATTTTLTAVPRDSVGNAVSGSVTWTSLNPNVATVSATTGVVTAVASGQVTVAATAGGVTGYALVTVTVPAATPVNLWAPMTSGTTSSLFAVWGASSSDVYAVGAGGTILHSNGTTWSAMASGTTQQLQGVWGTSGAGVYASGQGGTILHYNGSAWSAMASGSGQSLGGVWGTSDADIYVVGQAGTIRHYDGTNWSAAASGTIQNLGLLWGTTRGAIFAAGAIGTILSSDGASWTAMASGTGQNLGGVWGTSGADIYAVGYGGTIRRYNGTGWSAMSSGTSQNLLGVWGSAGADIYVVGWNGTILHYDGTNWSAMASGTTQQLQMVWGTSGSDVYAVGAGGTILRGVRGGAVAVAPIAPSLAVGGTTQLVASAKDAANNSVSGVTYTWGSSNTAVATVSGGGLVTAVASGAATITATAPGGAAGSAAVTVSGMPLIASFTFNGSGTDGSGHGYDAVVLGPVAGADRFGNATGAYYFNGISDKITIPEAATNGLAAGTIVLWARLNSSTVQANLFGKGGLDSLGNGTRFRAQYGGSPLDRFSFRVNGVQTIPLSYVPAGNYGFTSWHQYVFAWDASARRVYFDGRLLATLSGGAAAPATGDLILGQNGVNTVESLNGWLDDVRIFGAALATADVAVLWDAEAGIRSVAVTPVGASISGVGTTTTLTATPKDSAGTALTGHTVTWSSLNTAVATVNSVTGVVTAVASGQSTIAATVAGVTGYSLVTVEALASVPVNLWRSEGTPVGTGDLRRVFAFSPTDVWAVGAGGRVARFNGSGWSTVSVGVTDELWAVWGTSPGDLWVVGASGAILHYNGSTWSLTRVGTARFGSVWGSAPDDVWAGTNVGGVYHFNGSSWTSVTSPVSTGIIGLWGSAPTLIHAVGWQIFRYNGTSWGNVTTPTCCIQAVHGVASDFALFVGYGNQIQRFNGTSWSAMTAPAGPYLEGTWGSGRNDFYAVGDQQILRYDGSTWTTQLSSVPAALYAAGGTDVGDVYAVGAAGLVMRGYRGATVTVSPASVTVGDTVRLTASAKDASATSISGVSFSWATSDPTVATVSSSGLVTAVAMGTATITVTAPGGAAGNSAVTVAGRAARFDGATQYAQIAQAASMNTTVITVEAWIRLSASITGTNDQRRIVNRQDASNSDCGWGLEVFGIAPGLTSLGNQVVFHAGTCTASALVVQPTALTVGRWYHVAATSDGVTLRMYIDGTQVAQTAAVGAVFGPINSDILIGKSAPTSQFYFPGDIDEVRVWNVVRTQSQISDNRSTVLPSGTAGLIGYWRFDENSGTTTADQSGGGHPATLVAAPTRVNEGWRQ